LRGRVRFSFELLSLFHFRQGLIDETSYAERAEEGESEYSRHVYAYLETDASISSTPEILKGMTPPPWPHPLQLIVALSVASLSLAIVGGAPVPPTTA